MGYSSKARPVYIFETTKLELDDFIKKYPDLKKIHFVDKAVHDAITLEEARRGLQKSQDKNVG